MNSLVKKISLPVLAAGLTFSLASCAPKVEPIPGDAGATDCSSVAKLSLKTAGQLTVGTDSPAYAPWFVNNKPENGKGFESAVAYAVAKKLGFTAEQVKWTKVPFNSSYAPGKKNFDFDINQISINPKRGKVVTFSPGYYTATQGVIVLKGTAAAKVKKLAGLKKLRLGAQTGTTSLLAIRNGIKPTTAPLVFEDTNAAKQALLNNQVDAIVADLPTALYITAVEIPQGRIIGQFADRKNNEQFGLLMEKGSKLAPCVHQALSQLAADGTLASLEKRWLSDSIKVPVFKFDANR